MTCFLGGSVLKNPPANAGDARGLGLILELVRSSGGGNSNHSSILAWEIPRGASWDTVAKSRI